MPSKKKELSKEEQELFNYLKKISKTANQRLVRLERVYGQNTWASKKLINRLSIEPVQAWTKKGRIGVNKNMSKIQMKATIKATEQFLKSKTSTVSGIKEVKQTTIKVIAQSLGVNGEVTDEEAEALYDMLGDDYVKDVLKYTSASEFWATIEEAVYIEATKEQFLDLVKNYLFDWR